MNKQSNGIMANTGNPFGKVTVIGGGVIGAGWASRMANNGIEVDVYDPNPNAAIGVNKFLTYGRNALKSLTLAPLQAIAAVRFHTTLAEAVKDSDWIIEAVPEDLDLKLKVYAQIEASAKSTAVIASSTSGFKPSDLQAKMKHPERLLVTHPFNPVYLIPLVELVAGDKTDPKLIERAKLAFPYLGMFPLQVRREIEAFIADRFLEAVWREALWLIKDDIATTGEIDDAIRMGFGLRWAQMGLFETYRIAGGEAGMRHFIGQFGPCMSLPWTKLMDVPDLDQNLIDKIANQSDDQAAGRSIEDLIHTRDRNVAAILQALKNKEYGAGLVLSAYETQLYDRAKTGDSKEVMTDIYAAKPILSLQMQVPDDWTDYNNHMNESRYLQAFSDASDGFMRMIGIDATYVQQGGSYFTVETHICHLNEARAGEEITVKTQLIAAEGKKIHLIHLLHNQAGDLLASGEHLLLHVSLKTRSATLPAEHIAKSLAKILAAHSSLPRPSQLGRAIGKK